MPVRPLRSTPPLGAGAAAVILAVTTSSCSSESVPPAVASIQLYAAPPLGTAGAVNTAWIETEHGVIVIDALRTLPDARRAVAELQSTGKPIAAIVVTHPHPDHIGGLGVFAEAEPTAPIYASQLTRDEMVSDSQGLIALARSFEGADFPATITAPTRIVQDGEQLEIDGLALLIRQLGASEAIDAISIEVPALDALFAGDLVANQMTVALIEGRSGAWMAQLDELRASLSAETIIYPGHGEPGVGVALVDAQKRYLDAFRQLVLEHRLPDKTVDDAGKARIIAALALAFPDHPFVAARFDQLIEVNIDAVARELAAL
jgi:glyoxylase-like metal-dependent hydrolase (beta-lactamase superfamily II)